MNHSHYSLYIDETCIRVILARRSANEIHVSCLNEFHFEKNIYSEFLDKGETEISKQIMLTMIKCLSDTQPLRLTICFKMNNVKSQLAYFDANMSETELDRQCDLEAARFLTFPLNYTLYRERLSKKIKRTHFLYWLSYIPTKYFNRLELLLLPTKQKETSFSVSHKDLPFLLPKTNAVIMIIEAQETYLIISKVQAHEFISIKHFHIHHPNDIVYFVSWELKNELEHFTVYFTGNMGTDEMADTVHLVTKRKIKPLPIPASIKMDNETLFHNISPVIGTIIRDMTQA